MTEIKIEFHPHGSKSPSLFRVMRKDHGDRKWREIGRFTSLAEAELFAKEKKMALVAGAKREAAEVRREVDAAAGRGGAR
jgi:hypothetical protein